MMDVMTRDRAPSAESADDALNVLASSALSGGFDLTMLRRRIGEDLVTATA